MLEDVKTRHEYENVKYFSRLTDIAPFWIEMVGIANCDESNSIYREKIKGYVCEYIIKGSGTLQVNDNTYNLKEGDICFIQPFEKQRYYTNSKESWKKIFFDVSGTGVSSMLHAFDMKSTILFSDCEEFYPLFEEIFLITQRDLPVEQIMEECCGLFTSLLYRLHKKMKLFNTTPAEVQQLKRFINENIERELSIIEIADSIHRSHDYANRLFKRYCDTTPYAYYIHLRIEKAKDLLQHTSLSIKKISEKLGYKSSMYFSKQFHNVTGMTASDYRRIVKAALEKTEKKDIN